MKQVSEAQNFLNRFFGEGNKFHLDAIKRNQGKAGRILPWVRRITDQEEHSTVLPRWVNSQIVWYGIARSEREFRSLGEELVAFVGPTYSNFRGQRASLDPKDPVEASVLDWTGGAAFKIEGDASAVWEAIERMRVAWESRVARIFEKPRPTGRVLRDFYMAIRAGNRKSAEIELLYLQNHYRLDSLNLLFLKVYLLTELGSADELLNLNELPLLLRVRRPNDVTWALIDAVYRKELAPYEVQNTPASAVMHFHEVVLPKYGNLYSARAGGTKPSVVKSFILLAVGGINPRLELRDELLGVPGLSQVDSEYVTRLAAFAHPTTIRSQYGEFEEIKRVAIEGNYDRALSLGKSADHSPRLARVMFECAYELQTLEAQRAALAVFDHLSKEEKQEFLSVRWNKDYFKQLTGFQDAIPVEESIPTGLVEWMQLLLKSETWQRALPLAKQGANEWSITDLVDDLQVIHRAEELLQQLAGNETLHNAFPFLLSFLQKDDHWPRKECSKLYRLLIDVLVMSTSGGDDDLAIFNELVSVLLTVGVDDSSYLEIMGYAQELWERYGSPSKTDWVLDFLDLLLTFPCLSVGGRTQLLFSISSKIRGFGRRLNEDQKQLLTLLVQDMGQEEALSDLLFELLLTETVSDETHQDVYGSLSQLSIAIYTLTEAVGDRVKRILEHAAPGVRVSISHDKVGTTRLGQLAGNSDLFVIATASAKHAATQFIESKRSKDLPILRPTGKGSASMLRSIREFLAGSPSVRD
ncbi:MAG TPA: protein DpdD [Pyrinomonadaceae bacterium]|nr:protein DpdD [Pyrinomonadaceae bacterium]